MMNYQRQQTSAKGTADPAAQRLGGAEANFLTEQVQAGDFSGIRQYLARSRQEQDWQDRYLMLNLIAPFVQVDILLKASTAEPDAADLAFLLAAYCYHIMTKSRGARTAEETSEEQFQGAHQELQRMMEHLGRVYRLDSDDPTPHVFAVRGLAVFSEYESLLKKEYAEAVRLAPDFVSAHFVMVNARSKKWGGSHEESLSIARAAIKTGKQGNDLAACLFLAHFLVRQYARVFDKNKTKAEQYVKDKRVVRELNDALDLWIGGSYQPSRSSIRYLHEAALWYYIAGDYVRLQRVFTRIGNVSYGDVWQQIGNSDKIYADALQKAASAQAKKPGFLGLFRR